MACGRRLQESKKAISSKLAPHRHVEGRVALLQLYCHQLCANADLARSDVAIAFFWPSSERGDGLVIAPDGSTASIT